MESGNTATSMSSSQPKKRGRPPRPKDVSLTPIEASTTVLPDSSSSNAYFPEVSLDRIPTGSTMLDLVLGGGWALGRIANLVGDRSTGKSLLSIEACANFIRKYPNGRVIYVETEFAFDKEYAVSLGLPLEAVEFPNEDEDKPMISTIEKLSTKLLELVEDNFKHETLVVVDSLDALSDEAEMGREITESSYGSGKAKKMSELFRRLNAQLAKKNFGVIIVSQVRDNIGAMFGEKHTRSGGRALDFYASQVLWLANTGKIKKTRGKAERIVGVDIKAKCKKNKTGLPFRECDFPIYFNFGVEDLVSCLEFIEENEPGYTINKLTGKQIISTLDSLTPEEYQTYLTTAREKAISTWREVENRFVTHRKKY